MKNTILILSLSLFSSLALSSVAFEKQIPIDEIFVPSIYTEGEEVGFYITGWLPNRCHKGPEVKFAVNKMKEILLDVQAIHYYQSNPFCPPERVFFSYFVSLGKMRAGTYSIIINQNSLHEEREVLEVLVDNSFVPKPKLAIIDRVRLSDRKNKTQVTIEGVLESCEKLERVDILGGEKNTLILIPIVSEQLGFDLCDKKEIFFEKTIDLTDASLFNAKLLHVKGANQNINFLILE